MGENIFFNSASLILLIANIIILFSTLRSIKSYTKETKRLREINENLLNIEEKKLLPKLIGYFKYDPSGFEINFNIENIGGSPAKDIDVSFEPHLDFGDKRIEEHIIFNKENKIISLLSSKETISTIVGYSTKSTKLYKENKIPHEYKVIISYYDLDNKFYEYENILNIHFIHCRILKKNPIEKALKDLNNTLGYILNNLEK